MPQHKRGPWSQGEDQFLLSLVHIHGAHNWVRISQALGTRSPKQCRERFHQNLKPTLNHDPITPEEGLLIEQMVADMGKRWAEIARRLRGRSDNAVKNWWNGGMNRRRRSTNNTAAAVSSNNATVRRSGLELGPPPTPMQQQQQQHQMASHQSISAPIVQHQHQHPHQHHPFATHQQQPLPSNFPPHIFGMNMTGYHQPMPQPIRVPSNGPALRPQHAHALVETPLPSPSAYSQMSAEGAPPSLISDSSSVSARSPHTGASPVELPPLAAARHPTGMAMNMAGTSFVTDGDFPMHMHAAATGMVSDKRAMQPHEGFIQQQHQQQQYQQALPYAQMGPYNPAQRLAAGMQQHYSPVAHAHMARPPPPPPQHLLPSQPVQLPSIATLPTVNNGSPTQQQAQQFQNQQILDAELASSHARETPAPSATTPDGSPRDKMSLSNLTH